MIIIERGNKCKFNLHSMLTDNRITCIDKFYIKNTYELCLIDSIYLYFIFNNLLTLDDNNRIIASFFFLKNLSKDSKPMILKMKCFQTFKKKIYMIILGVNLQSNYIKYNFIEFFSLHLISKLSILNDYILNVNVNVKEGCILYKYNIYNCSKLRFVETHPIFFKWKETLNVKIKINYKKKNFIENISDKIKFKFQLLKLNNKN